MGWPGPSTYARFPGLHELQLSACIRGESSTLPCGTGAEAKMQICWHR